jgi:hypothetical protein
MNEYLVAAAFIALALALGAWFHTRSSRRLLPLLQRQAVKRGGRVVHGSWGTLPQLLVDTGDVEMRVSAMPAASESKNTGTLTYVDFPIRRSMVTKMIVREKRMGRGMLGQKLQLGEAQFDERFFFQGREPDQIRSLLAQGNLRTSLGKLPHGAEMQISQGRFVVSIAGIVQDDSTLDLLIEAASEAARILLP